MGNGMVRVIIYKNRMVDGKGMIDDGKITVDNYKGRVGDGMDRCRMVDKGWTLVGIGLMMVSKGWVIVWVGVGMT